MTAVMTERDLETTLQLQALITDSLDRLKKAWKINDCPLISAHMATATVEIQKWNRIIAAAIERTGRTPAKPS